MERRYTRINRKKLSEKLNLTPAQTVFAKYIKVLKLQSQIRDFRKYWYIDNSGYESIGRYHDWLHDNFVENTFDYKDFRISVLVLLIDCGLPLSFYDLLHDYIICSFRIDTAHERNEDIFCSLTKPTPTPKSANPVKPSYYTLYIHDYADIDEIKDFIEKHRDEINDQIDYNLGSVRMKRKKNHPDLGRDDLVGSMNEKSTKDLLKTLAKYRLAPYKYKHHELVKILTEEYGIDIDERSIQQIKSKNCKPEG